MPCRHYNRERSLLFARCLSLAVMDSSDGDAASVDNSVAKLSHGYFQHDTMSLGELQPNTISVFCASSQRNRGLDLFGAETRLHPPVAAGPLSAIPMPDRTESSASSAAGPTLLSQPTPPALPSPGRPRQRQTPKGLLLMETLILTSPSHLF